jgi:UTP--glucose-1-phosphate uridylyltransferase
MVRKAVIPAAGLGTRFLPASKSLPKEMVPIVDTPVIQYVVQEAVDAGITDILIIIGRGKRAIEEHFDRNAELEAALGEKGRASELEQVRRISNLADIHFVWQKELRGLGDAVACARRHVGGEPFAVLLGDTLLESGSPVTRQLMDVYDRYHESVVALEEVPLDKVSRYGVVKGSEIGAGVYRIEDFIEKPSPAEAPSRLAIAGRYVFTPDIFEHLDRTTPGKNNEIQLTDAMRRQVASRPGYGLKFSGRRFDVGNKLDFIRTNVTYALKRSDLREDMAAFIRQLAADLG